MNGTPARPTPVTGFYVSVSLTTNPTTISAAVTGPSPGPAHLVSAAASHTRAGAGRCSNCGSVRSVRVLPDGRHRCGCGHRWTPEPGPAIEPMTEHGSDGAP